MLGNKSTTGAKKGNAVKKTECTVRMLKDRQLHQCAEIGPLKIILKIADDKTLPLKSNDKKSERHCV